MCGVMSTIDIRCVAESEIRLQSLTRCQHDLQIAKSPPRVCVWGGGACIAESGFEHSAGVEVGEDPGLLHAHVSLRTKACETKAEKCCVCVWGGQTNQS